MVDRDRTGGQLVPGDTIGPWVVLERLDAGSFGSVFRCQRAGHPSAGDFALKLARNPKDPRFEREAELLQRGLPGQPHFEEQLAREALALANSAGEAADKPIDPIMSPELAAAVGGPSSDGADDELLSESESVGSSSTGSKRRQRQQDPDMPSWPTAALAATATALSVSLMLALVLLLARLSPGEQETPWLATPEEIAQFAPDAGVGEAVLESIQDLPHTTTPAMMVLTRPMPSQAFPGQKKPPCDMDYEIAALGACWVRLEKKPPCGSGGYEIDGLCVRAVFPAPRQPTSEEP